MKITIVYASGYGNIEKFASPLIQQLSLAEQRIVAFKLFPEQWVKCWEWEKQTVCFWHVRWKIKNPGGGQDSL